MKKSYEEVLDAYTKESKDDYKIKSIGFRHEEDYISEPFDQESSITIVRVHTVRPIFHDPETFYFFVIKENYPGFLDINGSIRNFWNARSLVEIKKSEFDEYVQSYLSDLKPERRPIIPEGLKFYEVESPEPLQRDFIMETNRETPNSGEEFILIHWHTTA